MTASTSDSPKGSTKPAPRKVELAAILVLAAIFTLIFVSWEDPYSLGAAFLSLIVYIFATALTLTLVRKPRTVLILLLVSLAVAGTAWAVKGDGYPVSSVATSYTTTCTTFTNSTSGSVQQMCGAVSHLGNDAPIALLWNVIAWVPLVGSLTYAVPLSRGGRLVNYGTLRRMLIGAIPAAALMYILLGARSSGLIGSPLGGLGPLNPYVAFRECDSTSSLDGCSFNNQTFMLLDFLFWMVVAILIVLLAGQVYAVYEQKRGRNSPIDSAAKWGTVALAILVLLGTTVVPAGLTQGGAIVTSGSSFKFPSYDYYLNIPVTAAHQSTLVGSFISNTEVDVYFLNYTQWDNNFGPYCPLQTPALFINATGGTLDAPAFRGSYNLIFCPVLQPPSEINVTILVTSPIRLSS